MALVLTIAGVTKDLRSGSLHVSKTANGRATASCTILSTDGSYRPAIDTEVILTRDGTRIFGGLLDRPHEKGIVQGAKAAIATAINAVDFHAYAERRAVKETIAAQTLKTTLQMLVTNYLGTYGVTLDAGQVNGPTLAALKYDYNKYVDGVLNELVTLTADFGEPYVWRIDDFKVLRAYQPSTVSAPFNVVGTSLPISQVIGDIEVEENRDQYANKIIVKVPSQTEMNRVETFTGNGSTTVFTLQYTLFGSRGYVTSDGVYETLTTPEFAGSATWTYDPAVNTLTRNTAPATGTISSITFDGTFSGEAIAQDAAEIAARGLYERVIKVETVPSNTTALAIAEGELAKRLTPSKTVKYRTFEAGILPAQIQTINVPRRNVNATAMITDVVIRDLGKDRLISDVTAVVDAAKTNLDRGWRDTYKIWAGDKTGGQAITPSVSAGAGRADAGPGGPNRAVQFNDSGLFGGDAQFLYYKTENSIVCGGGGSSITAADFESCQVFGSNTHIADA